MAKTLKEKINDVVFWICAGGAIYLIVAFLMKTDWLSSPKKLSELYEIIRDTLTLMAYFLAPAAAFTLFNDWREEHKVKSIISLIDELKAVASEIEVELQKFNESIRSFETSSVEEHYELLDNYQVFLKLGTFSRVCLEIDENNPSLVNLKIAANRFHKFAAKSAIKLTSARSAIQQYKARVQTFGCDTSGILNLKSQYDGKIKQGETNRGFAIEDFNKLIAEIKLVKSLL